VTLGTWNIATGQRALRAGHFRYYSDPVAIGYHCGWRPVE
jgi:hypothetical protein